MSRSFLSVRFIVETTKQISIKSGNC